MAMYSTPEQCCTHAGEFIVLIVFKKVTLEIIKTLVEICLNCFFFGPGFRAYYTIKGERVVFLLSGGDKFSQQSDITKAKKKLLSN